MDTFRRYFDTIEYSHIMLAFRRGLFASVPFFLIGGLSLVIISFPNEVYKTFINNFASGIIYNIFNLAYQMTIGCAAFVLMVSLTYYISVAINPRYVLAHQMTTFCSYMIITYEAGAGIAEVFAAKWTFTAFLVTFISNYLLAALFRLVEKREFKIYSDGADDLLSKVMRSILPICVVVFLFASLKFLNIYFLDDMSIQNIGSAISMRIFGQIESNFLKSLLYVFMVHIFWFFGMHGGNLMEEVGQTYLQSSMAINQELIAQGAAATEIYSKSFVDIFVLMGGSGTTMCLIVALFLAAKRTNTRRLAQMGIIPAIFNINELIVYGFPIFFNPHMLIPFILTPLVSLSLAAGATELGFLPVVAQNIEWSTPMIISGYMATNSINGAIFQVFMLIVGTLIYLPFVKAYENEQQRRATHDIALLQAHVMEAEKVGKSAKLLHREDDLGIAARNLLTDLKSAAQNGNINLYYQPQMGFDSRLLGAEGLLRWNHPQYGYLYPPLLISLAEEDEYIDEFGLLLIEMACKDLVEFANKTNDPIKISVNISAKQLEKKDFYKNVEAILKRNPFKKNGLLVFELTEQISMISTIEMEETICKLEGLGIEFSLDDFGMGHSSMMYLQKNEFAYVKLDGSLTRNLLEDDNSQNIIASIVEFSKMAGFKIIAEYVETEKLRDKLHELGCEYYQGYYYGKALPKGEFFEQFMIAQSN